MLLGKRPRPPIKRTTSLTEFSLDVSNKPEGGGGGGGGVDSQGQFDPNNPFKGLDQGFPAAATAVSPSPRPRSVRRNSADFHGSSDYGHFLRACTLCKRRLIPGRDIYMYRGDSAFCSLECRQQQMNQDERKEKSSLVVSKNINHEGASMASGSEVISTKGETVAAV